MNIIADNKKAYFDYTILQEYEAGVVLEGREVKSLRGQKPNMKGSYVSSVGANLWIKNLSIPRYRLDGSPEYEPKRDRRLLLRKKEIEALLGNLSQDGSTVVPLSIYFKNHLVKVKIAVVRGKKQYDKRDTIKKREQEREMRRITKNV